MSEQLHNEPRIFLPIIPYVFHNPRTVSVFGKCGPNNVAVLICKAVEEKISKPLFHSIASPMDHDVRSIIFRELSGRQSISLMGDDSTGLHREVKRSVLDPLRRSLVTWDMKLRRSVPTRP